MLPNNLNLVAKSCPACFFSINAYNPSASVCGGHSVALECARSPLPPLGVTVSCPWPSLFSCFRSVFVKMPQDSSRISSRCKRVAFHGTKSQLSCHYAGHEKSIFTSIRFLLSIGHDPGWSRLILAEHGCA